jgi:hypothetical protein
MLAPPFQYSYLYLMPDAVIEQALRDAQNILWAQPAADSKPI